MSNILTVQDNNNELGIGSSFISLGTNNDLQFTYDNNTLLQFNTSNNTIGVETIEQSTWNSTAIGTSFGGTGLTSIGSTGQVLSVKSDNSGLEWKTISSSGSVNLESSTSIATEAQSTVTIGNINQPLTINTSANFLISLANSTSSTNQILGYSDNSVKFIDESTSSSNIGTTDDLWNLVNYFYPSYKYLLMNLVVKTSTNSQNLISFNSTTYNYSLTLVNTFSSIIIIPSVFNDSSIKLDDQTITNNSINTITLTNSITSNQKISNFNLKIADFTNNIYTIQIIQKSITVEITGYKTATDRANSITNNNNANSFTSGNYYNDVIYIKIKFSENVTNFDTNDITVNNGSINSTFSGSNDTYLCTLTSNNTQNNTCEILVNSNVISDNLGNINSVSNTFSFIYDTVHPTMIIKAYSNYDNSNNTFSNEITHNSILNASHSATIFIKFESSENTDDFIENDIEEVNGTIASFQAISSKIYVCEFTCNSGDSSNTCSINVPADKFSDQATNTNLNNPSNTFSLIYDNNVPTLTTVTIQSNNTDTTKAISGNTITLSITASETITTPTVSFTIGSTNVSPNVSGSGTSYTATYTVQSSQNGSVSFSISSYADNAGNNGSSVTSTTNSSSITVDNIPGILDGLSYAKTGLIGAYALRKLFLDYSGPTIEVNNSHNLYFNNLGQIILIEPHETIANIINSRITKWYDQSESNHDLVPGQYYNHNNNTSYIGPQLVVSSRFSGYAVKFSKFTNNRITVKTPKSNSDTLWVNGGLTSFSGNQSHTIITSHFSTLNPTLNAYTGSPHTDNLFSIGRQGSYEGSGGSGHVFNQCIAYHPNFYYYSYYYNYGNQAVITPPLKNSSNEIYFTLAIKYENSPRNYKIFKSGTLQTSSNATSSPLNILKQLTNNTRTNFELGNFSQRNSDNDYSIGSRFDGEVENFMLYNTAVNDSYIISISNILL